MVADSTDRCIIVDRPDQRARRKRCRALHLHSILIREIDETMFDTESVLDRLLMGISRIEQRTATSVVRNVGSSPR